MVFFLNVTKRIKREYNTNNNKTTTILFFFLTIFFVFVFTLIQYDIPTEKRKYQTKEFHTICTHFERELATDPFGLVFVEM